MSLEEDLTPGPLYRKARGLSMSPSYMDSRMGDVSMPQSEAPPMVPAPAPVAPQSTQSEASPVRSALGRALMGFSEGIKAAPAGSAYNPLLGAIVGGLSGTGASLEKDQARQEKLQAPYFEAQAKAAAEAPYKRADEQNKSDILTRRMETLRKAGIEEGPVVTTDPDTGQQYVSKGWSQVNKPGAAADAKDLHKVINDAFTVTNPDKAPRGSLLGTAGQMNRKADEVITTLSKPNVTPQDISRGVIGLSALMQGGSPQDIEIKQSQYGNIYSDLANLKTKLTGEPSTANTPAIVAEIKLVANELRKVNNGIITSNLQNYEDLHPDISTHKGWMKYKADIIKQNGGGNGGVDYSSPAAQKIKADFQSGKLTKQQAKAQLDALK